MILEALLASAIFAGIVCVISIPWMISSQTDETTH
jgi:hypothetical protein